MSGERSSPAPQRVQELLRSWNSKCNPEPRAGKYLQDNLAGRRPFTPPGEASSPLRTRQVCPPVIHQNSRGSTACWALGTSCLRILNNSLVFSRPTRRSGHHVSKRRPLYAAKGQSLEATVQVAGRAESPPAATIGCHATRCAQAVGSQLSAVSSRAFAFPPGLEGSRAESSRRAKILRFSNTTIRGHDLAGVAFIPTIWIRGGPRRVSSRRLAYLPKLTVVSAWNLR